ncbi:50S ribosomal protein L5 [candidate division WOR-3 bacterium]|nr:50S ribosomal protein L5 [candidate division WOR-3 bacterium]
MAKEKKTKATERSGSGKSLQKIEVSDKPGGVKRVPRLKRFYSENVTKELGKKFSYNKMEIPKLEKIIVSMGLGKAIQDSKLMEAAVNDLMIITGQRPVIRKAKKAISNFKLREGMPVGISVTLRNNIMYEFFDRLVNVAAPRIRDFRGFKADGFDGRGNYNFGLTEQIVFPEIDYDKVYSILGMNITMVTTAKTDEEARSLLELMGVPFRKSSTERAGI